MDVINFDIFNVPDNVKDVALCLGYFDGIHLGHQTIINKALSSKKDVAVLTFDVAPKQYFLHVKTRYLTSWHDKKEILANMGVKYLLILKFDSECADLIKEDFVFNVLSKFNPSCIYCGSDYSFGKKGLGNPEFLKQFFKVNVIDLLTEGGEKISSSNISHLVEDGKLENVNHLLGRKYRISGRVVTGLHNGKKLGFPTANVEPFEEYFLPYSGVYETYLYVDGERYLSMTNIGVHPTIDELKSPIIEVHVINKKINLVGKVVSVEFISLIRKEQKFNSVDELINQLNKDREYILEKHSN